MSLRSGKASKGAPKHQNDFAFRHNPKSRKTKAILSIPGTTDNLCPRCTAIIEWRKRYRKYKPLKSRRHCNGCSEKAVGHAYHHLCQPCAADKEVCAKCSTPQAEWVALKPGEEAGLGGGEGGSDEEDFDDAPAPPPTARPKPKPAAPATAAAATPATAAATDDTPPTEADPAAAPL